MGDGSRRIVKGMQVWGRFVHVPIGAPVVAHVRGSIAEAGGLVNPSPRRSSRGDARRSWWIPQRTGGRARASRKCLSHIEIRISGRHRVHAKWARTRVGKSNGRVTGTPECWSTPRRGRSRSVGVTEVLVVGKFFSSTVSRRRCLPRQDRRWGRRCSGCSVRRGSLVARATDGRIAPLRRLRSSRRSPVGTRGRGVVPARPGASRGGRTTPGHSRAGMSAPRRIAFRPFDGPGPGPPRVATRHASWKPDPSSSWGSTVGRADGDASAWSVASAWS